TMQDMDLGRRYHSIYLAGATFNLLDDDATASAGLRPIAAHLEPDGVALVPLMLPMPTRPDALGTYREHITDDGSTMRVAVLAEERDEVNRLQIARLHYELVEGGAVVDSVERSWILHWHTQRGFRELAEAAGLSVLAVLDPSGGPAGPQVDTFVFLLTPA
ncbi:MAG: SAM-dependent methyltransferase, partial [Ilumatobacteraceae bacterium]